MGWFDEQIKQRIENDDALFTEGFSAIGNAVIGKKYSTTDSARQEAQAIRAILKYYGARPQEVEAKSFEDRLELMMRPTGIMRHNVKLTPGWYKDAVGPMIARLKSGVPVAVLPTGPSGYSYYDPAAGGRVKLNAKTAEISSAAECDGIAERGKPAAGRHNGGARTHCEFCVAGAQLLLVRITLEMVGVGVENNGRIGRKQHEIFFIFARLGYKNAFFVRRFAGRKSEFVFYNNSNSDFCQALFLLFPSLSP